MRQLANFAAYAAICAALASCSGNTPREPAAAGSTGAVAPASLLEQARAVNRAGQWGPVSTALETADVWPAASMQGVAAPRSASASMLRQLPGLPDDAGLKGGSDIHALALDNPYLDSGNITATPALLTLTAPDKGVSWAVFQVPLSSEIPRQLQYQGQIAFAANGAESGLWIGLANYATGLWTLVGPENVTAFSSMPVAAGLNYISPGGNLYFLVLAWDEDVIELDNLTLNATNVTPPLLPEEFGFALSAIGLNENTIGMDQVFAGLPGANGWTWTNYADLWTMMDTYWNAWYADPAAFPEVVRGKGESLGGTQSLQELLLEGTDEFQEEHRITAQSHSETLDPGQPLAKAIADFVSAAGGTPDQAAYDTAVGALDLADQNALAVVVEATRQAYLDRNQAMDDYNTSVWGGGLLPTTLDGWFESTHGAWLYNSTWVPLVYDVSTDFRFLRSFPYEGFFTPAARLADAIDDLTTYVGSAPVWEDVNLEVDTPAGRISIGGTGDDTHASGGANGHLILIDLGGNDTYNCHAGGTASYANGVSVCLDLAGGDTYNRMDDPSTPDRTTTPCDDNTSQQGAGRYGIGVLVDFAGSDEYYSVRLSQGSAVMGVGIQADMGGNDLYVNEALCLGSAYGGVGLCFDAGGDDEYRTYSMSGGYGGIMGVGLLVDQGSGIDTYYAEPDKNDTKPEYISAQDGLKNANFCFGAALGKRWADPQTDPVVGSGGFGFNYDGGGGDFYTTGVFGQGLGFYQSVGILFDADGADTHDGWWYTQGATAHVAVGALWDGGGSDIYNNEVSVGIGGAHDWSISWLLELAGDDTYSGSDLCFGRGYNNANAFLVDWLGAETYTPLGVDGFNMTLGRGGDPASGRESQPTIGVLVDVAGADNYDATYAGMLSGVDASTVIATPPGNQVTWVRANGNAAAGHGFYPLGKGVGYDGQ